MRGDGYPIEEREDGRQVARIEGSLGRTVEYVFGPIDPDRWEQLLKWYPATASDRAAYEYVLGEDAGLPVFSADFMCHALIESCESHGLNVGEVASWAERDPATVGLLWAAALEVNLSNPFDLDGPWFEAVSADG